MRDQTQISCIVCGCKNAHTATAPFNLTEAEQITRDVASIDQQIQLLYVKRTSLLKKLNTIQSVTYTIPPEVLSFIMQIMTDMKEKDTTPKNQLSSFIPLHLSAVSSYWRQVACSTPALWTYLRLESDDSFSKNAFVKNKIPLLRYYFERAKCLPLSLTFFENSQYINPLMDVALCDNPTRLFALSVPAEAMTAWQGKQTIYSQLEYLDITARPPWDSPREWTLPITPKLRHLILDGAIVPSIPSSVNITRLHLYNIPYSCCIRMLLECRETIIEFKLVSPITTTTSSAIPPPALGNTIYTFPRLRTLNCDLSPYEEIPNALDTLILQHLNLPSLRDVSFNDVAENHIQLGTPVPLMKTTSSVLSSVYVSHPERSYHEFQKEEIAQLFDQVDTKILFIDVTAQEFLNTLHTLTPSLHPENKMLIPALKTLCATYFVISQYGWYLDLVSKALVKMLEERQCGGTLGNPFFIGFRKERAFEISRHDAILQDLANCAVLKFTRCGTMPDPGHEEMDKYLVTFE